MQGKWGWSVRGKAPHWPVTFTLLPFDTRPAWPPQGTAAGRTFTAKRYTFPQLDASTSPRIPRLRLASKASRKCSLTAPVQLSRVGTTHRRQTFVAMNLAVPIENARGSGGGRSA